MTSSYRYHYLLYLYHNFPWLCTYFSIVLKCTCMRVRLYVYNKTRIFTCSRNELTFCLGVQLWVVPVGTASSSPLAVGGEFLMPTTHMCVEGALLMSVVLDRNHRALIQCSAFCIITHFRLFWRSRFLYKVNADGDSRSKYAAFRCAIHNILWVC